MEALTKKTISVEFEGRKYSLSDDVIMETLIADLGLPKDKTVKLRITKDGFVLV